MQINIFPLCRERKYSSCKCFGNFIHGIEFIIKFQERKLHMSYY